MKRWIAAMLCLMMLVGTLVACNREDTPSVTEPATTTTTGSSDNTSSKKPSGSGGKKPNGNGGDTTTPDPNRVPPEVKDFGGYEFKFILNNDGNEEMYEIQAPTTTNGEGINDTIYARNKIVEDLYNVKITQQMNIHSGTNEAFSFLGDAAISGDYFADIYSTTGSGMISSLAPMDYFYNIYDLQSLRLDSAWWDQDYLSEMTINGHAYTLTGDIQANDDLHQISLALNLKLYEEAYPERDFYDIVVKNGAWTMAEFYQTWNEFESFDGGTIGIMDEGDLVGYVYDSRTANYMYMASGLKTFTIQNDEPVLMVSSDKALGVVDWLQKIVDGRTGFKTARVEDAGGYEVGSQHFAAGQTLIHTNQFYDSLLYHVNVEDDIVYPPFPKYDAAQERYYSLVHACFEPLAVSKNVADKERSALILEALCYYSDKLDEEVMGILLQERLTSEKEAREILQLTLASKTYDIEYIGNVMGWTTRANQLVSWNSLSNYEYEMITLESNAITAKGNGKLQIFLKNYANMK